ncbi:MAG: hypothetical protein ACI85F_000444 [Bacteroidia bacterium]|jgi:hypothetical protein
MQLKSDYDVQFSFNDQLLSNCIVNSQNGYSNIDEAILELVKNCGFEIEKRADVYVIHGVETSKEPKSFILHGSVVDQFTKEPLPFASVRISGSGLITDGRGNFAFISTDSLVQVQVSHVGYFQFDSVVPSYGNQMLKLLAQSVELDEVIVTAKPTKSDQSPIIETPGVIKLNRMMASYLPGSSDNTINNLLRLQPGVLAAGEQTNEFTIWGSYKGQSHVIYDDITLFNFSSISDNIGAVNPLMISDIEVMKAGYNVHVGDRTGGVVNITSIEGRTDGFHGSLRVSDQSTAARLNVPIGIGLTLQAAGRFVFPQNLGTLIHSGLKGEDGRRMFGDGNVKLSGRFENGDNLRISLIGSRETLDGFREDLIGTTKYKFSETFDNYQVGGSGSYAKRWKRSGTTTGTIAYSRFSSSLGNTFIQFDESDPDSSISGSNFSRNAISELNVKLEHSLPARKVQSIRFGVGYTMNESAFSFDSTTVSLPSITNSVSRARLYIKDDIRLGSMLTLQPGVRIDLTVEDPTVYFQPRFSALLQPNKYWRVRLGWGMYNQFIAENALVDPLGNELYFWQVANGTGAFVQSSMHNVAGISFSKWGLNLAIEGYYKTLDGLIRWTYDQGTELPFFHANGTGRSYGFDFTAKKKVWKFDLSAAYSWSKTEDRFNSIEDGKFQRAPHDQRHELKASAILDLKPFFVSLNYVYGSGFPLQNADGTEFDRNYNRLDVAFLFQKKIRKTTLDVGLSVLNLTNASNVRYNSLSSFPDATRTYKRITRIKPLVFISVRF